MILYVCFFSVNSSIDYGEAFFFEARACLWCIKGLHLIVEQFHKPKLQISMSGLEILPQFFELNRCSDMSMDEVQL